MTDRQITCADCGGSFVFTQSEQAFYAEKGLSSPPKRCKACRAAKAKKRQDGPSDRDGARFERRGPRGDGPRGGGGDRGGGGGDRGGGGGERGAWRPRDGAQARGWGSFADRPAGRGGERPRAGRGGPRASGERRADLPPRRPTHPAHAGGGDAAAARALPAGAASAVVATATVTVLEPPARERPPRPRYDITCMDCGAAAQVPFKPIEGRQIFCQPCYRLRKGVTERATEGASIDEGDAGIVE